ncbi:hypothetical protein DM02DRAFT_516567 [Periconia macrospinosa]|uniref:Late endosomal/lysosomal adaptor and MAPK and MTOR activator-domain-containing protein n=1 Tax=Periconia macrospinosa TaxID=97972 RepID=A0A2V1E518_9PLEO|nr:hypothetical protein DM02DRAFT_516567 [Periconia macrospinosa]
MGICSSCLGLRRASDTETADSSHLLADPYQPQYGSINGPSSHNAPQPDPEEIRRQRDALERICAQTSDKLIHVSHATYTDNGHNSEYHRLFRERFPPTAAQSSRPSSADPEVEEDEATWLANIIGNSNDAEGSWERVEPIDSGALTIQFGDALGLDRKR